MDGKKLAKLKEKLYNQTPLLGDRIRQQAAKDLAEIGTPESSNLLATTFVFSKDQNLKNIILNSLRNIKFQEQKCIDAVCQVWADNRDQELGRLIKSKGWIASQPLELKVLVALKTNWVGVIKEEGLAVISPLLNLLDDPELKIANTAKKWLLSLPDLDLQQELSRIAVEENNQKALEIANEAGYVSEFINETALLYFIGEEWDKYREVDPQQELLAEIYYSSSEELRKRIDEKGNTNKRLEWVWAILGGRGKIKKIASVNNQQWQKIINILTANKRWPEMWSLALQAPTVWAIAIIKNLEKQKWLPKTPEGKRNFHYWLQLVKKCSSQPPQGKLVRCTEILKGHTSAIESILITPDSELAISAGDDLIRVWNLKQGQLVNTLKGHLKSVTSLALTEDGTLLASSGRDKTVCVWRLPTGNLVQTFSNHSASAWCLAMTKDGNLLVSGSYGETRLWQYASGRLFKTLTGHTREVQSVILSPNDCLLVTAGGMNDGKINLWQLPNGQHLNTLEVNKEGIWCLAISPNNQILVTGGQDNLIHLWQLPTGEKIRTLEGHTGDIWCLAISPDGKILATGSKDNTVKLWRLPTGRLLTTLEGHEDAIWCLAINQQGDLLATGSKDNTIRLWSLPDGECITVLQGHKQPIKCMQISPDGETLVSGSSDKTLRLWNWDLPRLSKIPISLLSKNDHQWIKDTLANQQITEKERNWLILMNELINHHHQQKKLKLAKKRAKKTTNSNIEN